MMHAVFDMSITLSLFQSIECFPLIACSATAEVLYIASNKIRALFIL